MLELATGINVPLPYLPNFYAYLTLMLASLSFKAWYMAAKSMLPKLEPKSVESAARGGFTLIEIMLVLAIAGLIMVIVFIAVRGAQRSQRDRARQDMANRAIA